MAALVDRGANGGSAGDDVRVISKISHVVNVQGIDNHQFMNILVITSGAVSRSQRGPVIIIMNQYSYISGGTLYIHLEKLKIFKMM